MSALLGGDGRTWAGAETAGANAFHVVGNALAASPRLAWKSAGHRVRTYSWRARYTLLHDSTGVPLARAMA
ncbi:hypothetical protein GCM10010302_17080 [Streptomyces polychromogenes]|uniref:Uncharacterized protein n=1 Tax=Streptomyces polychromogenes TaxID=67342 RepID=A0ABP3EUY0_9ACTN